MRTVNSKKRFIAGAACPECKELDSLRLWQHQEFNDANQLIYETEIIECVMCHHTQTQIKKESASPNMPNMIGQFKLD
ncbi:YheV family putative zinc ribbon protein [Thorsellia kenyensis]|uniref:YheV family putative zinc ribbon protein n=1 Tax=Thorsellia kenyensis TaxID=1549888 RepID=A0ABV6CF93_9GAMM